MGWLRLVSCVTPEVSVLPFRIGEIEALMADPLSTVFYPDKDQPISDICKAATWASVYMSMRYHALTEISRSSAAFSKAVLHSLFR